jgi:hypothetical protein
MKKLRKHVVNCDLGKFLMRTEPGANGFRAEIVVLRPEGVYTYTERK